MAVVSTGSASVSTWINENNALAAYEGLHINRHWESAVKIDNNVISSAFHATVITSLRSLRLFTTFNRAEHILSPDRVTPYARGWFPDPRGRYFYAALFLVVLNAAKIFKEVKNQPPLENKSQEKNLRTQFETTRMDQFLVVVSKATPYLMIITNIAMTIIQIHRGDSSACVTLAFTVITLIDIASWKPKHYEWYLKTVLDYPVSATAFYYADNKFRSMLIFNLALSNQTLIRVIEEHFGEQLQWLAEQRKDLEDRILSMIS